MEVHSIGHAFNKSTYYFFLAIDGEKYKCKVTI
jgi:hypothetical protein